LPIDPDNRVRFELMGLERVRIALVRGFDIPRGPMREDALDWVQRCSKGDGVEVSRNCRLIPSKTACVWVFLRSGFAAMRD
jgi:hypothetical protein